MSCFFFFFKQKTAYEMRISDWSSDVCSSDLNAWGSHDFDKTRFPDAKAMVDEVHALHGHVMISVWPKFYPTTDNAKALAAHGWLYQGNLKMGKDRKSTRLNSSH